MSLSEDGISNALGQRLAGMSPLPLIAWENRRPRALDGTAYDEVPDDEMPYLMAEVVPTIRANPTLKGTSGHDMSDGYFQVMAVSRRDAWASAGRQLIDEVLALFPAGLRLAVNGGGTVEMTGRTRAIPGYYAGQDWMQGIRLMYRARS